MKQNNNREAQNEKVNGVKHEEETRLKEMIEK